MDHEIVLLNQCKFWYHILPTGHAVTWKELKRWAFDSAQISSDFLLFSVCFFYIDWMWNPFLTLMQSWKLFMCCAACSHFSACALFDRPAGFTCNEMWCLNRSVIAGGQSLLEDSLKRDSSRRCERRDIIYLWLCFVKTFLLPDLLLVCRQIWMFVGLLRLCGGALAGWYISVQGRPSIGFTH